MIAATSEEFRSSC